jgi:probable phosphoglycerate mutase
MTDLRTPESPKTRRVWGQESHELPPRAREIILVRHGSTNGDTVNRAHIEGFVHGDPPLSAEGLAQANALAARLQGEAISRIFVTPLQRTHQTAAPLAALTGIAPLTIAELREVHLGDWEHEFQERAAAKDPLVLKMYSEESWEVIPNAEKMDHFAARIRCGIEKIVGLVKPDSTSLAFMHGGSISEVCRQATGSRRFAFVSVQNTSITRIIVHADGHWSLLCFNDVGHVNRAF